MFFLLCTLAFGWVHFFWLFRLKLKINSTIATVCVFSLHCLSLSYGSHRQCIVANMQNDNQQCFSCYQVSVLHSDACCRSILENGMNYVWKCMLPVDWKSALFRNALREVAAHRQRGRRNERSKTSENKICVKFKKRTEKFHKTIFRKTPFLATLPLSLSLAHLLNENEWSCHHSTLWLQLITLLLNRMNIGCCLHLGTVASKWLKPTHRNWDWWCLWCWNNYLSVSAGGKLKWVSSHFRDDGHFIRWPIIIGSFHLNLREWLL